jgi:hypothetical protein
MRQRTNTPNIARRMIYTSRMLSLNGSRRFDALFVRAAASSFLLAFSSCSGDGEQPAPQAPTAGDSAPGAGGSEASSVSPMPGASAGAAGTNGGDLGNIVNGTGMTPAGNGVTGSGDGLRIGDVCFPLCANAATDADAMGTLDGYGFEQNRSCIVAGSAPALMAARCAPAPAATVASMPNITPGPGFFIGATCFIPCSSSATDADAAGVLDGFGFEQGQSCVVPGSMPALQGIPCLPGVSDADGDGYLVADLCVPSCAVERLADDRGYGFEAQQTCVVEGSVAALQAARCVVLPREGLPEPGNGFQLTEGCFPPCLNAAGVDAQGFGFEQERACVLAGSDASVQGVPCVPPPATVTGLCPNPLVCPVANGVALTCGCGFRDGFAERKQVILNTPGASQYFLASAMMETNTLTANYPLGDVFPNGANKTGDAFNGGIAKQNWGMMRRCHSAWSGLGGGDFLTGAELNTNLGLDIQVYNECRQMFGNDWWSGHRLGAGRLGDNSADVQRFRAAMDWTNQMLTGHLDDDVYFFVVVPAI